MSDLVWTQPAGLVLPVLLALTAGALAVQQSGNRALLRLLAIGLLAAIALGPTEVEPRPATALPHLKVLLDASGSMEERDAASTTRFARATAELLDGLGTLQKTWVVETQLFGEETRAVDPGVLSATRAELGDTHLPAALRSSLASAQPLRGDAVLLLSDGRSTQPGALDAGRVARDLGVPVHVRAVGQEMPGFSAALRTASREWIVPAGAPVSVEVQVRTTSRPPVPLSLEVAEGDGVLSRYSVEPGAEGVAALTAVMKAPQTGVATYQLRLAAGDQELGPMSRTTVRVRSTPRPLRVLVIAGRPDSGMAALRRALQRKADAEITGVYQLSPDRRLTVQPGDDPGAEHRDALKHAEAVLQSDVVILGPGASGMLGTPAAAAVRTFVIERGGLLLATRDSLAAVDLLPSSDGQAVLDAESPATMLQLLLGEELAEAVAAWDRPLRVDRLGAGFVVTSDFRRSTTSRRMEDLWPPLVRWLVAAGDLPPGDDAALLVDADAYSAGRDVHVLLRSRRPISAESLELAITPYASDGSPRRINVIPEPGGSAYAAMLNLGPLDPGAYRIGVSLADNDSPATTDLQVQSDKDEQTALTPNFELLHDLAALTGGRALEQNQLQTLVPLRRPEYGDQSTLGEPAWHRWWMLALLLCLLSAWWLLPTREDPP